MSLVPDNHILLVDLRGRVELEVNARHGHVVRTYLQNSRVHNGAVCRDGNSALVDIEDLIGSHIFFDGDLVAGGLGSLLDRLCKVAEKPSVHFKGAGRLGIVGGCGRRGRVSSRRLAVGGGIGGVCRRRVVGGPSGGVGGRHVIGSAGARVGRGGGSVSSDRPPPILISASHLGERRDGQAAKSKCSGKTSGDGRTSGA